MFKKQEDQLASLHWRLEAEVKLALEDFKKDHNSDSSGFKQELSVLQKDFDLANDELKHCKAQLQQKESELTNLQIALGELAYHGEAADKLRRDLRAAHEQIKP